MGRRAKSDVTAGVGGDEALGVAIVQYLAWRDERVLSGAQRLTKNRAARAFLQACESRDLDRLQNAMLLVTGSDLSEGVQMTLGLLATDLMIENGVLYYVVPPLEMADACDASLEMAREVILGISAMGATHLAAVYTLASAKILCNMGRFDDALVAARGARTAFAFHAQTDPRFFGQAARALILEGEIQNARNAPDDALAALDEARLDLERGVALEPDREITSQATVNPDDWLRWHHQRGVALGLKRAYDDAVASMESALELLSDERLTPESVPTLTLDVAFLYWHLGNIARDNEEVEDAMGVYQESINLLTAGVDQIGPGLAPALARVQIDATRGLLSLGEVEMARDVLSFATRLLTAAAEGDPTHFPDEIRAIGELLESLPAMPPKRNVRPKPRRRT